MLLSCMTMTTSGREASASSPSPTRRLSSRWAVAPVLASWRQVLEVRRLYRQHRPLTGMVAVQVFLQGAIQSLHDKPIEIKRAVPREQMTAVKTPRAVVPASSAQRSPYSSPVFAKVPTGADSLFTSLNGLARGSYGLQDSPSSGSSRDHGPSIPAVHTSADLLPYPSYLDLHHSRRHSVDMHSLDRLSSQSVPAHLHRPAEPRPDAFSLFSHTGGLAADQAQPRPLHRHSLDSSLLAAPGLYSARGYADPWARAEPELPETLYALPELERLYLSAPPPAMGHHSLPADFLTISAGQ